jgi:DnaJ-class molecular chaperone
MWKMSVWPDILFAAMLFGGGRRKNARQGESVAIDVDVDLADFYTGGEVTREIRRMVVCRGCSTKPDSPKCKPCTACPPEVRMVRQQVAPGMFMEQQQRVPSKERCRHENKVLKAVVEKGMADGSEIVFEHESEQRPGQIPGDVVFRLHARGHARFQREGDNLHTTVHLTLREALVGFRRVLKHLDGHDVVLDFPATVTQHGISRTIAGEGMAVPVDRVSSQAAFGDLIVHFEVRFPASLTSEQTKVIEQFF